MKEHKNEEALDPSKQQPLDSDDSSDFLDSSGDEVNNDIMARTVSIENSFLVHFNNAGETNGGESLVKKMMIVMMKMKKTKTPKSRFFRTFCLFMVNQE